MTKDDKGVWWYTADSLVVGFHYYAVLIDSVPVMDREARPILAATGSPRVLKFLKVLKAIIIGSIKISLMERSDPFTIGLTLMD